MFDAVFLLYSCGWLLEAAQSQFGSISLAYVTCAAVLIHLVLQIFILQKTPEKYNGRGHRREKIVLLWSTEKNLLPSVVLKGHVCCFHLVMGVSKLNSSWAQKNLSSEKYIILTDSVLKNYFIIDYNNYYKIWVLYNENTLKSTIFEDNCYHPYFLDRE